MAEFKDDALAASLAVGETMNIAIVTSCRSRLDALRQTLPALLAQRLPDGDFDGVVVVDYGSDAGCVFEFAESLGAMPARVEADSFLPCHSRNVGIREAIKLLRADWVMLVSCDMLPTGDDALARFVALRNDGAVMFPHIIDGNGVGTGWNETCLINSEAFQTVRGYDESHTGYGHDDSNFYLRLRHWGFAIEYGPACFTHIEHERPALDPAEISRNWGWAADMLRPCNPRGYGR